MFEGKDRRPKVCFTQVLQPYLEILEKGWKGFSGKNTIAFDEHS
jgi:hypothetical protein